MKRNYDRLTRVSQYQDKKQTWRKDVLRHTPRRNPTSLWLGVAVSRFAEKCSDTSVYVSQVMQTACSGI